PAVGVIVDHAAGRAGQPDAGGEHEQGPVIGHAAGGQPERPPGGPQQQQHADGAVTAQQLPVLAQPSAPLRTGSRRLLVTFVSHAAKVSRPAKTAGLPGGSRVARLVVVVAVAVVPGGALLDRVEDRALDMHAVLLEAL